MIIVMLVLGRQIGHRRLIRRWYGAPEAVPGRPARFWTVAGGVALPAAAVTPFPPAAVLPHTTGVRLLGAIGAGLLAGAAAASVERSERSASH